MRVGIDLVSMARWRVDPPARRALPRARLHRGGSCATAAPAGPVAERLAARFAAKEATIKVLRPAGQGDPLAHDRGGAPHSGWVALELAGQAACARRRGRAARFCAQHHPRGRYAAAVVIAEQST